MQVFSCEICDTFKNTFFSRTLPVAASVSRHVFLLYILVAITKPHVV